MKNTLAENLLRFGVKNLSKSDVKKIEEQTLDEAPSADGMWNIEEKWINLFVKQVNDKVTEKENIDKLQPNSIPRLSVRKLMKPYTVAGADTTGQIPVWYFKIGTNDVGTYGLDSEDLLETGDAQGLKSWITTWTKYLFNRNNPNPVSIALGKRNANIAPSYIGWTNTAAVTCANGWQKERMGKPITQR